METKKLTPEQIELLKSPLPSEAIAQHPTKTFLSTIKAIYVVERLNDVFGIGSWNLDSREVTKEAKMVVVQTTLTIADYGIRLESYGGNDNADLGDAYKGATTDALTKICSMLEIGMDVFKGKSTAKPVAKDEDNRPWLTEIQLEKILERIKGGEKELIESASKAFKMKKEFKQKLEEAK